MSFVISLVPFAAQADIADVFRQFDRGAPADRDFVKTLILGIEDGFEAANDELKANGKPMLYCAPEALKFTGDQLVEILRRWVDANRVKAPRLRMRPRPRLSTMCTCATTQPAKSRSIGITDKVAGTRSS